MTEEKTSPKTIETYKILLVLLGIGVLTYFIFSTTSVAKTFEVNGFAFTETACPSVQEQCYETTVVTNIGVHPITFYSDPREVSDILVSKDAVAAILNLTRSKNTSVTIAFDEGVPGDVGVAATLIARVTGERLYGIDTAGAVYGSQVTCAQSTADDRVIYLTQTDQEGVFVSDGCIIVTASDVERLRQVVDAYTMHLLLIL